MKTWSSTYRQRDWLDRLRQGAAFEKATQDYAGTDLTREWVKRFAEIDAERGAAFRAMRTYKNEQGQDVYEMETLKDVAMLPAEEMQRFCEGLLPHLAMTKAMAAAAGKTVEDLWPEKFLWVADGKIDGVYKNFGEEFMSLEFKDSRQ